jgi:hypothetical protein
MRVPKLMHYATVVAFLVVGNQVVAHAADSDPNNPAAAATDSSTPPNEKAPAKKPVASPAHDPVASAFVLPRGVTLNQDQQAAYDQLKADKEPVLRQAIEDLQSAKGNGVTQAAKKVRETRAAIHKAITDIVSGAGLASPDANKQSKAGGPEGSGSGSNAAQYGGGYPAQGNGAGYGNGGYYPAQSYGGYYPRSYPYNNYSGKSGDGQSKSYSGGNGGSSTSVPGKSSNSGSSMSNGTSGGRSYPPSRQSYSRPSGGSSSRH